MGEYKPPYDIRHLKEFHGMMTKYLVEESSEFRLGEEGVFSGDQCIFMAPSARRRKNGWRRSRLLTQSVILQKIIQAMTN